MICWLSTKDHYRHYPAIITAGRRLGQPSPGSDELLSDDVNPVPFLS